MQTDTLTLTKDDVSYLRRADDWFAAHRDAGNVIGAVKRARYGDAFDSDKRVEIPVAGNGREGWFASLWTAESVLRDLRAGDSVSFHWYPDAGTNENARNADLHVDHLYLDVTRGKRTARYLAAVSVCPDNSARMCRSY